MKNSQTTVMLHQQTGKQSRTRFPDSRQNLKIWRVKNNKGKPPKWKPMSNCGPSKRNSADSKNEWTDWKRSWTAIRISQSGRLSRAALGQAEAISKGRWGWGQRAWALPPYLGSPLAQCDPHG